MKKLIILIGLVLVMCLLVSVSCAAPPAPAPRQAPAPMPSPMFTNSESASRIAELEAKIRRLESDNQRLLTENQELRSNLVEITSMLESVQSEIPDILIIVTEIQNDSRVLAAFLQGLPSLPTLPAGLTISQIDDAIDKASKLRDFLKWLPRPTPLAELYAPEWCELDKMKNEFIRMTEWMEDLEELPEFLNTAGDLDDLRYQEMAHLENINATMDNIKSRLEEIMRIR